MREAEAYLSNSRGLETVKKSYEKAVSYKDGIGIALVWFGAGLAFAGEQTGGFFAILGSSMLDNPAFPKSETTALEKGSEIKLDQLPESVKYVHVREEQDLQDYINGKW